METEHVKNNVPAILIVDDISVNVTILENILTHEGYEALKNQGLSRMIEDAKEAYRKMAN